MDHNPQNDISRKWKAVVNGKKFLNSKGHNIIHSGEVRLSSEITVYDFLRLLADHLEENNEGMEFPEGLSVWLETPQPTHSAVEEDGQSEVS